MSGRRLSQAELAQRREAAVKSGAHSATKTRPRSDVIYERLRRRVARVVGRTDPRTRLRLRMLAVTLAKIEVAEAWLTDQPSELFVDVRSGTVHPLVDRVDRWVSQAAALIGHLPDATARTIERDWPNLHGEHRV